MAGYVHPSVAHQANFRSQLSGGYGAALKGAQQQYGSILSGYQALQSGVAQQLQGGLNVQKQGIADQYAQERGAASQSMVSRGLGNSTVQDSVQRGLVYDQQKATNAAAAQFGAQNAQYQANIGLQGLQAQQRGSEFSTSNATNIAQGNQRAGLQMMGLQLDAQKAAAQNQFQYAQLGQQGQIAQMNAGLQQQQMAYQYW